MNLACRTPRLRSPTGAGCVRRVPLGLFLLLAFTPGRAAGQNGYADFYWVAGRRLDLAVYWDSFAVATVDPVTGPEAAGLVRGVLPGATAGRRLDDRIWIVGVDSVSREDLREAVHLVAGIPDVVWGGIVVRGRNASGPALVTDEFIAQFAPGVTRAEIDALNKLNAVSVVTDESFWPNHFVLRVTRQAGVDALSMANRYFMDSRVVYAHPNLVVQDRPAAAWFPTDPGFNQQWHLYNPGVINSGIRADIHAPEAWDITKGDPAVTIAIVELNGFQPDHEDLAGNLWTNPWTGVTSRPFPGKSGDVHGWNFEGCPTSPPTPDPYTDPCGSANLKAGSETHGTQVAGVAAAIAGNGHGGVGVCPECRLMLVRMGMTSSDYSRATAFWYASDMGADVINASFTTDYDDDTFKNTLSSIASTSRGSLGTAIIAAAPYFFDSTPNKDFCPPNATSSHLAASDDVISVLRSNEQDLRAGNAEGSCLDLIAPGKSIYTASPTNTYVSMDGNSFAAPVVTGVVGLMLSKNPGLSRKDIYDILTATADKVGPVPYVGGRNDLYGYGRVNAFEALNATPAPSGSNPPPSVQGNWEVGIRTGLVVLQGGGTEYQVDLPGNGPLGAPVVYASRFLTGLPLMFDIQVGYSKAWGSGSGADERRVTLGGLAGWKVNLGSSSFYVGPSVAVRSIDVGGVTSTEWGTGGALGTRFALGAKLSLRMEFLYRTWPGLSLDEYAATLGLGVRLP